MTRFLVVGYGQIAERGHVPTLRERGHSVVGAVDLSPERRAAAESDSVPAFESLDEAIDETEPDVVDVAVPPGHRLDVAREAAAAGKDLLLEKPVCLPGEQEELLEACRDVTAVPVHNYLHAPHFRRLKEVAGDASEVRFGVRRTGFCRGNEDWNPDWRVDRDVSGGGILMDHGYHAVYVSNHLAGAEPETVEVLDVETRRGVDFYVDAELRYPDGTSRITLDWDAGERSVTVAADDYVLRDDRIEGDTVFDHGLSDGSIHREWFAGVLAELEQGDSRIAAAAATVGTIEEIYREAGLDG